MILFKLVILEQSTLMLYPFNHKMAGVWVLFPGVFVPRKHIIFKTQRQPLSQLGLTARLNNPILLGLDYPRFIYCNRILFFFVEGRRIPNKNNPFKKNSIDPKSWSNDCLVTNSTQVGGYSVFKKSHFNSSKQFKKH